MCYTECTAAAVQVSGRGRGTGWSHPLCVACHQRKGNSGPGRVTPCSSLPRPLDSLSFPAVPGDELPLDVAEAEGLVPYVVFCAELLSLSTAFSRSICVGCSAASSLFMAE